MKTLLALAVAALGLSASPVHAVALGLQSSTPTNARVVVRHEGRQPVKVRIVVVDENLQDLPTRAMPANLLVTRNSKPRKSFVRLPEGAYAVCARVEPSSTEAVAVAYQSCQKLREKGTRSSGLSIRLGNALGN